MLNKIPVNIEMHLIRSKPLDEDDRFHYQSRHVHFDIKPTDKVLDIGSGAYPFPHANILVDLFLDTTRHRHEPLVRNNKPLILADIHNLPFRNRYFDFVYCSHVLEHVDDPRKACAEIMRAGKKGFIETPTLGKDALFAWARNMHRWHIVGIAQNLCFFEYSSRQLDGIKSSVWRDIILGKWHHPLQDVFYNNQDIFNVMFPWFDKFSVFVFHLDGTVETLNAPIG